MFAFRWIAAVAATVALCLALTLHLYAADVPSREMPKLPAAGAPSSAKAPDLGDMTGAGKTVGGLSPEELAKRLRSAQSSKPPLLRGQTEQRIFADFSRAVVLIVTKEALGSGAVIGSDGTIITNWHVIGDNKTVGVIYKPAAEGTRVYESDAVQAKVVRFDQVADLAIIKVAALPRHIAPLKIADPSHLKVGADVHAIGHPMGEIWSYTKGVISQIRPGYEWTAKETGIAHRADVVQTQTPVSPGNSGGPLLDDAGALIGVATFGGLGQPLNFAVGASEIKRVSAASSDRIAPKPKAAPAPRKEDAAELCETPVTLKVTRTEKNDGDVFAMDSNCNGKVDLTLFIYDAKGTIEMAIDANENGKPEAIYVDLNADFKFDIVYFDIDEDGKIDLVGRDLDDSLEPARVDLVEAKR